MQILTYVMWTCHVCCVQRLADDHQLSSTDVTHCGQPLLSHNQVSSVCRVRSTYADQMWCSTLQYSGAMPCKSSHPHCTLCAQSCMHVLHLHNFNDTCSYCACQGMNLIGLPVSAMWTCRCKARGWEGSHSRASRMSCSARTPAGFSCPPAPACSSSDMPRLWSDMHFKHLCNLSRSFGTCHREDK